MSKENAELLRLVMSHHIQKLSKDEITKAIKNYSQNFKTDINKTIADYKKLNKKYLGRIKQSDPSKV